MQPRAPRAPGHVLHHEVAGERRAARRRRLRNRGGGHASDCGGGGRLWHAYKVLECTVRPRLTGPTPVRGQATWAGTARVRVDGMADTTLDLTLDAAAAHRAARRLPLGERHREAPRGRVETALRALPHLTVDRYGNNVVARTEPGPGGARDPRRAHRHRPDRGQRALPARRGRRAVGLRHLRHEVRRRRPAAHRGHRPGAQPRPHLRLLRQRRGRRPPQRPEACGRGAPRVAGGRLRGPAGALRRPGRGRLPGHAAGAAEDEGRAGALRAQLDGLQRHPRRRPDPRAPRRLRAALPGHRRPGVPRGPQRRRHRRAEWRATSSPTSAW